MNTTYDLAGTPAETWLEGACLLCMVKGTPASVVFLDPDDTDEASFAVYDREAARYDEVLIGHCECGVFIEVSDDEVVDALIAEHNPEAALADAWH